MAPQMTAYFQKLPAIAQGASGYCMTFTIDCSSIKFEKPNDEHMTIIQVSSIPKASRKRRTRKIAKAKKFQTEGSIVNDPNTMGMAPRLLPIQIMIGSILITLGITESVMVTSTKMKSVSYGTLEYILSKRYVCFLVHVLWFCLWFFFFFFGTSVYGFHSLCGIFPFNEYISSVKKQKTKTNKQITIIWFLFLCVKY